MIWGENPNDMLGYIAGGGDANGDGYDDFLAGSLFSSQNGFWAGKTFFFLGNCWDEDLDGSLLCEGDCDDTEVTVYPEAPELCDGLDNDCDTIVDEDTDIDLDGDGQTACEGDCAPEDPLRFLGNAEICDDEIDNDCDGAVDGADGECDTGDDDDLADDDDSTGDDDSASDDDSADDDAVSDDDASSAPEPEAPGCECSLHDTGGIGHAWFSVLALLRWWRAKRASSYSTRSPEPHDET